MRTIAHRQALFCALMRIDAVRVGDLQNDNIFQPNVAEWVDMGKFIAAIAAIAFGLFILGRCSSEDTPDKKAKADMNAQALKAIKSEEKIKDAVITPVGVLYAGVISDGKNRDGYAQYLCEVLRQNSASAHRVKVVDIASVVRTKSVFDWVIIGEARCK